VETSFRNSKLQQQQKTRRKGKKKEEKEEMRSEERGEKLLLEGLVDERKKSRGERKREILGPTEALSNFDFVAQQQ